MRSIFGLLCVAIVSGAAVADARSFESALRGVMQGQRAVTAHLASNRLLGRDNDTPGSAATQDYLVKRLRRLGPGAVSGAPDPYRQPFTMNGQNGTNLLGLIPGSDLANEYVIVGAHYDHLDTRSTSDGHCRAGGVPGGAVCNGATDNAAGAAAVLSIGKALRALAPLRRSVILALWDAEEDGLLGSAYYTAHPVVPIAQTVGYVNFDILGAVLLPSVRTSWRSGSPPTCTTSRPSNRRRHWRSRRRSIRSSPTGPEARLDRRRTGPERRRHAHQCPRDRSMSALLTG